MHRGGRHSSGPRPPVHPGLQQVLSPLFPVCIDLDCQYYYKMSNIDILQSSVVALRGGRVFITRVAPYKRDCSGIGNNFLENIQISREELLQLQRLKDQHCTIFWYRDGMEDPLGTSNTLQCMGPLGLSLVALQFCRCSSPLTSSTLPGQPLQVIQGLPGTSKPALACLCTLLTLPAQIYNLQFASNSHDAARCVPASC